MPLSTFGSLNVCLVLKFMAFWNKHCQIKTKIHMRVYSCLFHTKHSAALWRRSDVTELSERFDVTAETIRRDLAVLDREGVVHRVHGGAVASQSFQTSELTLDSRLRSATTAKMAIARAAMEFLPQGTGSIFLDAGT